MELEDIKLGMSVHVPNFEASVRDGICVVEMAGYTGRDAIVKDIREKRVQLEWDRIFGDRYTPKVSYWVHPEDVFPIEIRTSADVLLQRNLSRQRFIDALTHLLGELPKNTTAICLRPNGTIAIELAQEEKNGVHQHGPGPDGQNQEGI